MTNFRAVYPHPMFHYSLLKLIDDMKSAAIDPMWIIDYSCRTVDSDLVVAELLVGTFKESHRVKLLAHRRGLRWVFVSDDQFLEQFSVGPVQ